MLNRGGFAAASLGHPQSAQGGDLQGAAGFRDERRKGAKRADRGIAQPQTVDGCRWHLVRATCGGQRDRQRNVAGGNMA